MPDSEIAHSRRRGLNGLVLEALGVVHIRGFIAKRLARFKSKLLVLTAADLANHVVPTVIPANMCFAIHQSPGSAGGPYALLRGAVFVQSDQEMSAAALADFPFTDEVGAAGQGCRARSSKLNLLDLAGDLFAAAILINDGCGRLQVDAGDCARREGLTMAIPIDDDNSTVIVSDCGCHGCQDQNGYSS